MSQDYFIQFIDRAVVDPMLRLSWREYQKRYNVNREEMVENFSYLPSELSEDEVDFILDNKSVLWTMKTGGLMFLNAIICSAPHVEKKCPTVNCWDLFGDADSLEPLCSAAMNGFLRNKIDAKTLNAVAVISCQVGSCINPSEFLYLTKKHKAIIRKALKPLLCSQPPIYSWQKCTLEEYNNGYITCLGLVDTKRFIHFLTQAWEENWDDLRESEMAKHLIRLVKTRHFERPCMISGFE